MRLAPLATLALLILTVPAVWADASAVSTGTTSTDTGTVASTDTGATDDTGSTDPERARVIHELNTYLIMSYEARIDRILSDLHQTMESLTPDVQIGILRQISESVRAKLSLMETHTISPNRREILTTLFHYLDDRVQMDIAHIQAMK